jgi:hypothetical protein
VSTESARGLIRARQHGPEAEPKKTQLVVIIPVLIYDFLYNNPKCSAHKQNKTDLTTEQGYLSMLRYRFSSTVQYCRRLPDNQSLPFI